MRRVLKEEHYIKITAVQYTNRKVHKNCISSIYNCLLNDNDATSAKEEH